MTADRIRKYTLLCRYHINMRANIYVLSRSTRREGNPLFSRSESSTALFKTIKLAQEVADI